MEESDFELDDRLAPPRAPLRVMQILAELANSREGATLARLSEQLQLPKTSVFSLLRSLEAGNYVQSANGHHRLAQEAYHLAANILAHDTLAERLRPALQSLQEDCAETVMLAIPTSDWTRLTFADVIEASSSLRFTARVGAERPLYSTSVGLALLAYANPEQQKRYTKHVTLSPLTPTTISSTRALLNALKQTRQDGYVVNSGSVPGLAAIGVPVFDAYGGIVASVSVAGPSTRIEGRSSEFIERTLRAGAEMSKALGYKEQYPKLAV